MAEASALTSMQLAKAPVGFSGKKSLLFFGLYVFVVVVVVVGITACSDLCGLNVLSMRVKTKKCTSPTRGARLLEICFASAKHHFSKHASRACETHIYTCHCLRHALIVVRTFW